MSIVVKTLAYLKTVLNNGMPVHIFLVLLWSAWKSFQYLMCCRWKLELHLIQSTLLEMQDISVSGYAVSSFACTCLMIMLWYSTMIRLRILFQRTLTFQLRLKFGKYVRNYSFFFVWTVPLSATFIMCVGISNHTQHCWRSFIVWTLVYTSYSNRSSSEQEYEQKRSTVK